MALRGALKRPLFHGGFGFAARLNVVPFLVLPSHIQARSKETSTSKRRCGRPWFPPFDKLRAGSFAKGAKDGAPLFGDGAVEVKISVGGNEQECPFHTGGAVAAMVNSRFLRSAVAGAPAPVGMTRVNFRAALRGA